MKKVDEGVDLFDEIWEKVYSAEQQNQKEKYEMDLKKEIKKLQRLRDQIKTWIGSNDVKDKDALIEARKLIETKMEQFKVCEKETKTKTYSKEGLARQEKLDPAEEAKRKTTKWIGEYIEKFNSLVDEGEVEIETLSAGRGKKSNKHLIEEHNEYIKNHKFHINKLEGIMRLVNNDRLDVEPVDALKEDIDYYLEEYEDNDYMQSYDEEYFYESLGLEELDVVNVDRVTRVQSGGKTGAASVDDESMSSSKTGGKEKKSKKSASTIIPLTIGRARNASSGEKQPTTPSKIGRATSVPSAPTANNSNHSSAGLGPTPKPAPPVQTGGASMASILKREGEQQEKERQQKALQQQQVNTMTDPYFLLTSAHTESSRFSLFLHHAASSRATGTGSAGAATATTVASSTAGTNTTAAASARGASSTAAAATTGGTTQGGSSQASATSAARTATGGATAGTTGSSCQATTSTTGAASGRGAEKVGTAACCSATAGKWWQCTGYARFRFGRVVPWY